MNANITRLLNRWNIFTSIYTIFVIIFLTGLCGLFVKDSSAWMLLIGSFLAVCGSLFAKYNKFSLYIQRVKAIPDGEWIPTSILLPEDQALIKNPNARCTDKVIIKINDNNKTKILESARAFNLYSNKWEWQMPTYDKKVIALNKYQITHWMNIPKHRG